MSGLLNYKREDRSFVAICGPMVRYSKLPLRLLARRLGCDLAMSPMIIAESFVRSPQARAADLQTSVNDRPLIVQFASRDSSELLQAALLVCDCSDGIDLNCGCPQRWAVEQGVGCSLMRQPALMADMVRTVRRGLPSKNGGSPFSVSVKMRICDGSNGTTKTVEMLRQLDRMGVDWVTIHARTPSERMEPARWAQVREIVALANVKCDTVVNGDITSLETAQEAHQTTGCLGVMSARGILSNPALFHDKSVSPVECANLYMELAAFHGAQFSQIHQHVYWMLESSLNRADRTLLHATSSWAAISEMLHTLSLS